MKQVLRLPKALLRRYRVARVVDGIDSKSDELATYEKSNMPQGMYKSTIDDVLESPGLAEKMRQSELRRLPKDGERIVLSWDLPPFMWEALLGSKTLSDMVTAYIGPDVRLDDVYLKTVLDGYDATSEGWHDDNVGYRVKVFMVFDTEGQPAGTYVQPTPRPHPYRVQLVDEIARIIKKPKMDHRPGELLMKYEAGDCLVFDTNIPHRGDFSSGKGVRYCVIAEFIDRNKSDALRGRAPCGPGQGKRKLTIPAGLSIDPASHQLIDQNLLSKANGAYQYGY
ncbi:hypothetical protein [Marimonas lutisalis]|uniref:hypothetical protein n=1 Tax=Marimonas lutisalis TaxID=2545756 RepID=UPI0010F89C34|nr:hypothetical protein [Marimonas lutisalis]